MKKQKSKKCRNELCKKPFTPTVSTTQNVCDWKCSLAYDKQKKAKKEAKQHVQDKREFRLNDNKLQEKLAWKAFSRFIRLRDKDLPCISCGTTNDIVYAAGHFRSRGAMKTLMFHEDNVHKQCNRHCNEMLSSNYVNYKPALIEKIGADRVAWLEGPHETVKLSAADLVAIKKKYLLKCHELEKLTGDS